MTIAAMVALFAVSILCDIAGHVCFKIGANGLPVVTGVGDIGRFLHYLFTTPYVLAGVGIYVVEFVVWLQILSHAPLSLAFPVASLNYCGVMLASRWFLDESISRRQWLGVGLITAGVAVVGLSEAAQG